MAFRRLILFLEMDIITHLLLFACVVGVGDNPTTSTALHRRQVDPDSCVNSNVQKFDVQWEWSLL